MLYCSKSEYSLRKGKNSVHPYFLLRIQTEPQSPENPRTVFPFLTRKFKDVCMESEGSSLLLSERLCSAHVLELSAMLPTGLKQVIC
jgi:hypothetical protein